MSVFLDTSAAFDSDFLEQNLETFGQKAERSTA